ncbi:MAG: hypothetical protein NE334_17365 [Lentisphaeraceae bacterium]|nr:hypothetical protein [Lentisphaeraceae bacterium]
MFNHAGLLRDKEHGKQGDTSGEIVLSGNPNLDRPVTDALDMVKKVKKCLCTMFFVIGWGVTRQSMMLPYYKTHIKPIKIAVVV